VGIPTRPTPGRTTGFRAEIPPNKVDGSEFVSFSVVYFVTFLLRPKDNHETTLPILGQTGLELPIGRPFGLVGRLVTVGGGIWLGGANFATLGMALAAGGLLTAFLSACWVHRDF
jgi:hypothetical protein